MPGAADPQGVCAWELDRTGVVISSFSKYWGMTGWRLGWAIVPDDLVQAVDALAGNVALCPPAPAQMAAMEAFSEQSYAEADASVAEFSRTRDFVLGKVAALGWVDAAPADGAFYFYAKLGPALAGFRRFGASTVRPCWKARAWPWCRAPTLTASGVLPRCG